MPLCSYSLQWLSLQRKFSLSLVFHLDSFEGIDSPNIWQVGVLGNLLQRLLSNWSFAHRTKRNLLSISFRLFLGFSSLLLNALTALSERIFGSFRPQGVGNFCLVGVQKDVVQVFDGRGPHRHAFVCRGACHSRLVVCKLLLARVRIQVDFAAIVATWYELSAEWYHFFFNLSIYFIKVIS